MENFKSKWDFLTDTAHTHNSLDDDVIQSWAGPDRLGHLVLYSDMQLVVLSHSPHLLHCSKDTNTHI